MRALRAVAGALTAAAVCLGVGAGSAEASSGSYVLTATTPNGNYAPTFTGNGLLGVRVPVVGQGYAPGTVPAQSELAGFYVQPPGGIQQRANIPTWSTFTFSDGGTAFSPTAGHMNSWRQSIDFHTGIVTTFIRWTAPSGHVTDLTYRVLTDRARSRVGLVSLTVKPYWSGTAAVTDEIDGTPANLDASGKPADFSTQMAKGWDPAHGRDWVSIRGVGTNITEAEASQLGLSSNIAPTLTPVDQTKDESVGQRVSFPVVSGQTSR